MKVKSEIPKEREPILFRHLKLGDMFSPVNGEHCTNRHIKTGLGAAIYYECSKGEWTQVDVGTNTDVRVYPDAFISPGQGEQGQRVDWFID